MNAEAGNNGSGVPGQTGDFRDEAIRIMAATKSNLAARPRSLAFQVDVVDEVPVIRWLGYADRSAHDLLTEQKRRNLDGHRRRILEAVERDVHHHDDIALDVGISVANARRTAARMCEDGILERSAPGEYVVGQNQPTKIEPFPYACVPIVPNARDDQDDRDNQDKQDNLDTTTGGLVRVGEVWA